MDSRLPICLVWYSGWCRAGTPCGDPFFGACACRGEVADGQILNGATNRSGVFWRKKLHAITNKTKKSAFKKIERWPSNGRFRLGPKRAFLAKNGKKQPFWDFEWVGLKILNFSFQNLKDKFFSDFFRYFGSFYLLKNNFKKIIEMSKMGCFIAIALLLSYSLHIHRCIHCTDTF